MTKVGSLTDWTQVQLDSPTNFKHISVFSLLQYQICILMAILATVIANCQAGVHSLPPPPSSSSVSSEESSEEAHYNRLNLERNLKKYNNHYDSSSSEEDSSAELAHLNRNHKALNSGDYRSASDSSNIHSGGHYYNGRNYNSDYKSSTPHVVQPSNYDQSSTTSKSSKHHHRSSSSSSHSSRTSGKDYNQYNNQGQYSSSAEAKNYKNSAAFDNYGVKRDQSAYNKKDEGYYQGSYESNYNKNAQKYNERNEPERFKAYTSSARSQHQYGDGRRSSNSASAQTDYKTTSLAAANADKLFNRKSSDQYKFDFSKTVAEGERKSAQLNTQKYSLNHNNNAASSFDDYHKSAQSNNQKYNSHDNAASSFGDYHKSAQSNNQKYSHSSHDNAATSFDDYRKIARANEENYKDSDKYYDSYAFEKSRKSSKASRSSNNHSDNYYSHASTKSAEAESRTLSSEMGWKDDGAYEYHYETTNGIKRSEIIYPDGSVQGTTSYISPEGIEVKTSYIADEYGYRAVGDHIPKVPDYIVRSLEYIRNHPYVEKDYYTGEYKTPRSPKLPEDYAREAQKKSYDHSSH